MPQDKLPQTPDQISGEPIDASQRLKKLELDLNEALDCQSATSEILDIISSSPRDAQPVFEAIVRAGQKLFPNATISIALRVGDEVKVAAISGPDDAGVEAWRGRFPAPLHPETIHGYVILNGKAIDLPDVADAQDRFSMGAGNFLASGYRAVTMMPMGQGDTTVGALAVLRWTSGKLTAAQFAILQTIVAQANIAIENTHLVNRMREANAALENVSQQLAKYIPPQLYRSIMEDGQQAAIESRRRKLTIFFSDIADFSEITDQLEAEELTALLNEYLSEMSKIANRHGAYFDKFIGDAMMLYFGDPETKGDKEDASACVRMAIEMQRRLRELQSNWHQRGLIDRPFEARIGINTGYCTVGNFGSEDRMDYTIIGYEVNLAARLEAESEPGGILLAAETYSLVKDWLPVEERDPVTVRGFRNPIRTFAATGIYDDHAVGKEIIHHEDDGYSFTLDPERLDPDAKAKAIRALRALLTGLED
ncbi:MAG: adenylate/guanylate cyclase domain-containing protein [Ruegeria sp.]